MKKSLGQHFLSNPSLAEKIVRLAQIQPGQAVLEIGPGRGILTEALLKAGATVVAVEKDRDLIPGLRNKFEGRPVEIIEGDILQLLTGDFSMTGPVSGQFSDCLGRHALVRPRNGEQTPIHPFFQKDLLSKVVANLPYNIATEIIFRLLEIPHHSISDMYLMVQKEVGERLVAKPGSKKYGILSVLTQIHAETKIVLKVAPSAFIPPPKVESVVLHFKLASLLRDSIKDLDLFKKVVKTAFGTRRKQIKNALSEMIKPSFLEVAGLCGMERAEEISVEQFIKLANKLGT